MAFKCFNRDEIHFTCVSSDHITTAVRMRLKSESMEKSNCDQKLVFIFGPRLKNLSSRFPRVRFKQPAQLQRLARKLKFHWY